MRTAATLLLLIAPCVRAQDLVAALRSTDSVSWRRTALPGPPADSLRALGVCEALVKVNEEFRWRSFSRLDVDGDGRNELVYTGSYIHCAEGPQETMRTIFYSLDGGKARVIFEATGLLGEVSRGQPWNAISFVLRNDGCCGDPGFSIAWYTPRRDGGVWGWHPTTFLSAEEDLVLPMTTLTAPVPFSVTQDRYNLRLAPIVDDTTTNDNLARRGNTFARYAAGARGIALAEQTDNTGRVWWFVVMQSADVDRRPAPEIAWKAGWMSSRFVRREQ